MRFPTQINRRALKRAWVHMWKNDKNGIIIPIHAIIIPS